MFLPNAAVCLPSRGSFSIALLARRSYISGRDLKKRGEKRGGVSYQQYRGEALYESEPRITTLWLTIVHSLFFCIFYGSWCETLSVKTSFRRSRGAAAADAAINSLLSYLGKLKKLFSLPVLFLLLFYSFFFIATSPSSPIRNHSASG